MRDENFVNCFPEIFLFYIDCVIIVFVGFMFVYVICVVVSVILCCCFVVLCCFLFVFCVVFVFCLCVFLFVCPGFCLGGSCEVFCLLCCMIIFL